jgi:transcriptional regulator GlxA family with amidase domain
VPCHECRLESIAQITYKPRILPNAQPRDGPLLRRLDQQGDARVGPDLQRSVWLVVFPGFELLDLSGPLCAFNLATFAHGARYECSVVSAGGDLVNCSSGFAVMTKRAVRSRPPDTLVVVGSPHEESLCGNPETVKLIRSFASKVRRVASICTGSFLLAAAGVLDGRQATTHWRFAGRLRTSFPKVRVTEDNIFVRDGQVWTSAGITSGIDLALALIEDDFGAEMSKGTARDMVVYYRRRGGQSQFSTILELEPTSERIRHVLSFAREHLSEALSVDRLAEIAGISPRQFARIFLKETGDTPAHAIERLRAEAALPQIQDGFESMEVVARNVGFHDMERMRRAFIRIFGLPPQSLRRTARVNRS